MMKKLVLGISILVFAGCNQATDLQQAPDAGDASAAPMSATAQLVKFTIPGMT